MISKEERSSLKLLAGFKWGDRFSCYKCGGKHYYEREENLARICSDRECNYEETVLKNSAFEGLRFPVTKAIGIIEYLIEKAPLDYDKKVITTGRGENAKTVSYNELVKLHGIASSGIDDERFVKLARDFFVQHTLYVAAIAKEFKLTVKTMDKFLLKLSNRLNPSIGAIEYFTVGNNSLERCLQKLMRQW